jgi:sarcosine oxidase subunit beta
MAETADVVIIGGGSTGTSIAMRLAQRGVKKVVLVEKKYLASGPTGKSMGNVRPFCPIPETMKILLRSLEIFKHFREDVGGDPGLVPSTRIRIAREKDKKALEADAKWEKQMGANIRLIYPSDLAELLPQLNLEGVGVAIHYLDACHLNPVATTGAYAMRARDLGADIREEVEVTAIKVSGGKVRSVVTSKGEISTPVVVNAAGVWASRIGHMVGIDIPITIKREQICSFLRPWDFRGIFPIVHNLVNEHIYRSEGNDILLAVDSFDFMRPEALVTDPDHYNEEADEAKVKVFLKEIPLILPPMKRASYRGGYAGIYDVPPDQSPILGKVPEVAGFYLCCGWSGVGFGQSAAIGEVMAELITEDKTTLIDWTVFRLSRFKEGEPLASTWKAHH